MNGWLFHEICVVVMAQTPQLFVFSQVVVP
jgi:hypothetical protein